MTGVQAVCLLRLPKARELRFKRMHFRFPTDRVFYFGVEIDGQPRWDDALAYLGDVSGRDMLDAQRAALKLEGGTDEQIADYLPAEGEDRVALMLLVQELSELSTEVQDWLDGGESVFERACVPGAIPAISGGRQGRALLVFLMLGVMQAAGFTPLLREDA